MRRVVKTGTSSRQRPGKVGKDWDELETEARKGR